ncbi:hypothetical protein DGWBC_1575 [Dehalogenimonas sp. WBC-2]|nr:hypothetical protein DGWBC_1575 [Dehalogenimonas sp. WBC-2]
MDWNIFLKLLLQRHNFALLVGIIAGFLIPNGAQSILHIMIPLLILAMTLSMSRTHIKDILKPKLIVKPLMMILFFNFIILGMFNIALGYLLSDDFAIRAGFVILAGAPPSLAIPAFAYNLKGNVNEAFIGTTLGYIASIAIMPVMVGLFLNGKYDSSQLFLILFELIVIPIILSQFYRVSGIMRYTERYHGHIINWCIAIVCFSLIGINHDLITSSPKDLLVPSIVAIITIFILGEIIFYLCRRTSISYQQTVNIILFGTMKKWAGASAIALTLFGEKATLPATLGIIVGFLYYFWLVLKIGHSELPLGVGTTPRLF